MLVHCHCYSGTFKGVVIFLKVRDSGERLLIFVLASSSNTSLPLCYFRGSAPPWTCIAMATTVASEQNQYGET